MRRGFLDGDEAERYVHGMRIATSIIGDPRLGPSPKMRGRAEEAAECIGVEAIIERVLVDDQVTWRAGVRTGRGTVYREVVPPEGFMYELADKLWEDAFVHLGLFAPLEVER